MPYSKKQQGAARADLGRVRKGKKPRTFTSMTEEQLADFASEPIKKKHKKNKEKMRDMDKPKKTKKNKKRHSMYD